MSCKIEDMEKVIGLFFWVLRTVVPYLLLWLLFLFSFLKDRSRYRNCIFFMLAIVTSLPLLTHLPGNLYFVVMVLLMTAILFVPAVLIVNGIQMLKREGKSLANMLSLLLGIAIGIGEVATFLFVLHFTGENYDTFQFSFLPWIFLFVSLSAIYFSLSFLSFTLYSLFLEIVPRKRDFDYVIVHGAGLLHGDKVSKLLSDRIDKAIEVYHKDPTPPILVPSGGQGSDESVSEARAMADYMLAHGIPEDHILLEDESTTTMENLKFSKKKIEEQSQSYYAALVTSNYHVYRALRYCRKIGLSCTGIGSHVAAYYWPSALIREYVAIHNEKKHLVILLAGWVVMIVVPMLVLFFSR